MISSLQALDYVHQPGVNSLKTAFCRVLACPRLSIYTKNRLFIWFLSSAILTSGHTHNSILFTFASEGAAAFAAFFASVFLTFLGDVI